ncbi:MAG: SlyX family protein [Phycisphaerales bacterium]|nr:SlyX family protein [Phycisphaerales bacterium]
MPQSDPKNNSDRIQKLEETIAFSEHTTAELNGEIRLLNTTVLNLVRRLASIEGRLVDLNNRLQDDPGDVPPPHSAGPDIPRDPL